jgi:hypothetical protein
MRIKPTSLFFSLVFSFLCAMNALAADNSFTLTTYYPAPNGDYQDLTVAGTLTAKILHVTEDLEVDGNITMHGDTFNMHDLGPALSVDDSSNLVVGSSGFAAVRMSADADRNFDVNDNQFIVKANGNVGIGVGNAPAAKLDIQTASGVPFIKAGDSVVVTSDGCIGVGNISPTARLEVQQGAVSVQIGGAAATTAAVTQWFSDGINYSDPLSCACYGLTSGDYECSGDDQASLDECNKGYPDKFPCVDLDQSNCLAEPSLCTWNADIPECQNITTIPCADYDYGTCPSGNNAPCKLDTVNIKCIDEGVACSRVKYPSGNLRCSWYNESQECSPASVISSPADCAYAGGTWQLKDPFSCAEQSISQVSPDCAQDPECCYLVETSAATSVATALKVTNAGTDAGNYAGYFEGNVKVTKDVTVGGALTVTGSVAMSQFKEATTTSNNTTNTSAYISGSASFCALTSVKITVAGGQCFVNYNEHLGWSVNAANAVCKMRCF